MHFLRGLRPFLFFAASAASTSSAASAAFAAADATVTAASAAAEVLKLLPLLLKLLPLQKLLLILLLLLKLHYNICRVPGFEPEILRPQTGLQSMSYTHLLLNTDLAWFGVMRTKWARQNGMRVEAD